MSRPAADGAKDPVGVLLTQVATGDDEAFARLYDQVAHRVHGLATRVVGTRAHAEELTQEVFLQVWREAGRFDPARGSGLSWLLTITHRRAVDRVRSEVAQSRRQVVYEYQMSAPEADSTSEEVIGRDEARTVHEALACLTPIQREAIELAYLHGLTYQEVSERLELPLGTAKTRIRDGMLTMRRLMGGVR